MSVYSIDTAIVDPAVHAEIKLYRRCGKDLTVVPTATLRLTRAGSTVEVDLSDEALSHLSHHALLALSWADPARHAGFVAWVRSAGEPDAGVGVVGVLVREAV